MRRLGLAIGCAVLFASANASAFCRTTTEKSAPDYDAVVNGCFAKGVPLFWRNACVGYSIARGASKKISYESAANNLSQAFTRWTGASCKTDGTGQSRVSIDVRDLGPADCAKVEYKSGVANQNVIVFRDDSWPYPPQVLGLTTVVYAPDNGEIYNADMEINMYNMDPIKVAPEVVGPQDYDFLSVVTHEAGHFLGMAHSDVQNATMYARYDPGQTNMRDLAPDDIEGICEVYRPSGERAVLNGKVTAAPQCDPTPRGGYSQECQEKATGCNAAGSNSGSGKIEYSTLLLIGATCALLRRARRASSSR